MNKKVVITCIRQINKHSFYLRMRYFLTKNSEYVFRYRNINESWYGGTYRILERYYRIKGYRCDAVIDMTGNWSDNHFIISAFKSQKRSFFNER